jgi:hypothetical protein
MKITLLKGQSQYEVLNTFIDDVAVELAKFGHTTIIDLIKINTIEGIKKEIPDDTAAIFSFNGIGQLISQHLNKNIIYITSYIDHPMYLMDRIKMIVPRQISYFVDKAYVELVENLLPKIQPKLLPQAGCYNKSEFSIKDKTIDVLFCGSYSNLSEFDNGMIKYSPKMKKFINTLIKEIINKPTTPLQRLANEIARKQYFLTTGDNLVGCMVLADKYTRALKRRNLLEHLLKNGITIHCYGNGWENSELQKYDNFIMKPATTYREVLDIMNKSKIVLCNLPNLPNGAHDRIFSTMQMHSISVTDLSTSLKEMFLDMKDIVFYNNTELGYKEVTDKIKTLLSNDTLLEEITKAGHYIAMKNHTWKNRAETIMKDLEELCNTTIQK